MASSLHNRVAATTVTWWWIGGGSSGHPGDRSRSGSSHNANGRWLSNGALLERVAEVIIAQVVAAVTSGDHAHDLVATARASTGRRA